MSTHPSVPTALTHGPQVNPDAPPHHPPVDQRKVDTLKLLYKKYTANIPSRPVDLHPRTAAGDVVLVTGTTGMFGCHILAQLTLDPAVKLVYALNRASDGLVERHLEALKSHGLLGQCLSSPKFRIIGTDITQPKLGLSQDLYEEIQESVTHIIHNAWPVSFNRPLLGFQGVFQATRNLVDLALSSPYLEAPSVMFVSSVSVVRRPHKLPLAPEEPIKDPAIAVGWGYSESKWVAESILLAASEKAGLHVNVVRVGQLCGSKNGHWNEKEALPAIVKAASVIHCLPDMPGLGLCAWLPAYEAAKALVEMRGSAEPVLHLIHPKPQPWRALFGPIAEELHAPLVPYWSWVAALEADSKDPSLTQAEHVKRNPALRLLRFFQQADIGEEKEPLDNIRLSADKAARVVPWLSDVKIGEPMIKRWVEAWRETGYLPSEPQDKKHAGPPQNGRVRPKL